MTKRDKVGLALGAVALLLLIWLKARHNVIYQNNGDLVPISAVTPLQQSLHTYDIPGISLLINVPELQLFGSVPSCNCGTKMVH